MCWPRVTSYKYGTSNALLQFRNGLNLENGSLVGKQNVYNTAVVYILLSIYS
jgi:hypothetical protein